MIGKFDVASQYRYHCRRPRDPALQSPRVLHIFQHIQGALLLPSRQELVRYYLIFDLEARMSGQEMVVPSKLALQLVFPRARVLHVRIKRRADFQGVRDVIQVFFLMVCALHDSPEELRSVHYQWNARGPYV